MDPRRYTEEEVAAIFREAAEAQKTAQQRSARADGLTLAELQAIGLEAGLTPEFIADAADAMDRTSAPDEPGRLFAVPIRVDRTVDLPAPLSDEAWARLVVELRETFRAHGNVRRDGFLREWTNGNLRILLEPTETGQRLRMSTVKSSGRSSMWAGVVYTAVGLAGMLVLAALAGPDDRSLIWLGGMIALVGAAVYGYNALTLPRWADERRRQMEHIGTRAVALSRVPSADEQVEPRNEQENATASLSNPDLDLDPEIGQVDEGPGRRRVR